MGAIDFIDHLLRFWHRSYLFEATTEFCGPELMPERSIRVSTEIYIYLRPPRVANFCAHTHQLINNKMDKLVIK